MQELIKITENDGVQVVSMRELSEKLEIKTDFSTWSKRMFDYGFVENVDYSLLRIGEGHAHNKIDYVITLDTAKEISMLQKSEKGKMMRQYFIDCEKRLHLVQSQQFKLPQTYLEALELLVEKEKETIQLLDKIAENKDKVDFYDQIADTTSSFDMQKVAGMLKIPGIGRNKLFEILRDKSVLQSDNCPYRSYINQGYFIVVETKWTNPKTGETTATFQTRVTQKRISLVG